MEEIKKEPQEEVKEVKPKNYTIKEIDSGILLNIFTSNENISKVYYISEKGMFSFVNEETLNDCLKGKKSFLINSISYRKKEAIKEFKYFMKNIKFEDEDLKFLLPLINKIS